MAPDARGRSERWRIHLSTKPPLVQNVLRGTVKLQLTGQETTEFEIHYVVHQR